MIKSIFSQVLASGCLLAAMVSTAQSATWTPDPSLTNPQRHIDLYNIGRSYCDTNWNATQGLTNIAGYQVRSNFTYAYGLMITKDPTDVARAKAILTKLLQPSTTQQEVNTNSVFLSVTDNGVTRTVDAYGSFRWTYNAVDTGGNPVYDVNGGIFDALVLADIAYFDNHNHVLDTTTRSLVDTAFQRALTFTMAANIGEDYTNIALTSAAVAAAGKSLYNISGADTFAQTKLSNIYTQSGGVAQNHVVYEYLAPTYYGVDLTGVYSCQRFSFNTTFGNTVASVEYNLWTQIGIDYHAPTGNMVGPWNRTYGQNMLQYNALVNYFLDLGLTNGYPVTSGQSGQIADEPGTLIMCDLPVTVNTQLNASQPYGLKTLTASAGPTDTNDTPRTLYVSRCKNNFMLGTVAVQDMDVAKRNLVAFWQLRTPVTSANEGFLIDESPTTASGPNSDHTNYHNAISSASGRDVLVCLSHANGLVEATAPGSAFAPGSLLTFAPGSVLNSLPNAVPYVVQNGTWLTYVTPITNISGTYAKSNDASNKLYLYRPWLNSAGGSNADGVGTAQVLAYVISFRPSDEPQPTVSNKVLQADGSSNITASANVYDPLTGVTTTLSVNGFTH
ncbi:MAG: hypothetical protein JWM57_4077 [Phycisphaerales bacterium]|nr:hypothetical protein [Phycisphaerales bacterium]